MATYIFYYDGFSGFETSCACFQFHKNLKAAALENRIYVSEENQKYIPDIIIDEIDPDDVDLLIIPGGDPSPLFENEKLKTFLLRLNDMGKHIGAICGGPSLLAKFGLLDNRKCTGNGMGINAESKSFPLFEKAGILQKGVVTDGNITTATGQYFVEFSLELFKQMGGYKNREEEQADYNWWILKKMDS